MDARQTKNHGDRQDPAGAAPWWFPRGLGAPRVHSSGPKNEKVALQLIVFSEDIVHVEAIVVAKQCRYFTLPGFMIKLALNISLAAEDLVRQGRIELDYFKCPAWPDLVKRVSSEWPAYVHFPLSVGRGWGDALNTETRDRPDWGQIEGLLAATKTPYVNVHLSPRSADFPHRPNGVADAAFTGQVTAGLIKDLAAVVQRFGADKVIAESIYDHDGAYLLEALRPEVISQAIETTGCGFLFDLSHARMAARGLGMTPQDYIGRLPMGRVREVHVTGIQVFEGVFVERLRQAGTPQDVIQRFEGTLLDHLPMTDEDWPFLGWTVDRIREGAWSKPWAVSFEYGGIGSWWEIITDPHILESQIPRMREMVRKADGPARLPG